MGSYWGGTADELWSSPGALHKCLDPSEPIPKPDSSLHYRMLSPFMRSTIKGAVSPVWCQGEANAQLYFPADDSRLVKQMVRVLGGTD
jgi:hypothetical protein